MNGGSKFRCIMTNESYMNVYCVKVFLKHMSFLNSHPDNAKFLANKNYNFPQVAVKKCLDLETKFW